MEAIHPDDITFVEDALQDCFTDKASLYEVKYRICINSEEYRWQLAKGSVVERDASGKPVRMTGTSTDVNDCELGQDTYHSMISAFSAVTGKEFYSNVVNSLVSILGVDVAVICEVKVGENSVNVLAGSRNGQVMELPVNYDLSGTPCEQVIEKAFCFHESGVQNLYPDDLLLVELGIDGYMGVALFDAYKRHMGLIAVMHSKPIANHEAANSLLDLFAARVATEIERHRSEEYLRKSTALYKHAEKLGKVGCWEWDFPKKKMVSCSKQFASLYGMTVNVYVVEPLWTFGHLI